MKPIMHCVTCNDFRLEECPWGDCELADRIKYDKENNPFVTALVWAGMIIFGVSFWAALGWVVL